MIAVHVCTEIPFYRIRDWFEYHSSISIHIIWDGVPSEAHLYDQAPIVSEQVEVESGGFVIYILHLYLP